MNKSKAYLVVPHLNLPPRYRRGHRPSVMLGMHSVTSQKSKGRVLISFECRTWYNNNKSVENDVSK
jgi:hypothetical protein